MTEPRIQYRDPHAALGNHNITSTACSAVRRSSAAMPRDHSVVAPAWSGTAGRSRNDVSDGGGDPRLTQWAGWVATNLEWAVTHVPNGGPNSANLFACQRT
jgi:hypothetical protein